MAAKPPNPDILSVYTYWDSSQGLQCPLCSRKLTYAFNDGGRNLITLKGSLWVVSNYYRCTNEACTLHKSFPMVHQSMIKNKKFGKDVWERVIRYHFKTHLDIHQIQVLLWDDSDVSISRTTIRNIIQFFEQTATAYMDQQVYAEVQRNQGILLSLDGAQPEKGEPALWIFSDRITGHVLAAELLDTASAPVLAQLMSQIEMKYGVSIQAVISDKQKNIVNAVKQFNPNIPHAFCQYHFLNHIMEPIISKDSHIATQMKKSVRAFSIIVQRAKGFLPPYHSQYNPLYYQLAPLAEEFLNAISVTGKKWEIFPGKEIYENLASLHIQLGQMVQSDLDQKVIRSIDALIQQLDRLLAEHASIYHEIIALLDDTKDLRHFLAKQRIHSKTVKKTVDIWIYRLQSRLKRRKLENQPANIPYQILSYTSSLEEIWQQWIRLEWSYHEGLYYSYDIPEIEKTNNAMEQLINRTKRHFKKWLGTDRYQQTFQDHAANYVHLLDLEYSSTQINEILWVQSVAFSSGNNSPWEHFQVQIKRQWRIREVNTGNIEQCLKRIHKEGTTKP